MWPDPMHLDMVVYLASCRHHFAAALCAKLCQGTVQDADCIVEVHSIDSQPLLYVFPWWKPHGLHQVTAPKRGIYMSFEL